jgi:hypothetical protein
LFVPLYTQIPPFLQKTGFKDITDMEHNPCLELHGDNFFEYLGKNPEKEKVFASAMSMQDNTPPITLPNYPFQDAIPSFKEHELKVGAESAAFLVDVGGGRGQFMMRMLRERPNDFPGRKVLQDLPGVIASLPQDGSLGFEAVAHDFNQPQTIKHAKFYHFRGIMHDWPDSVCLRILEQTKPAMLEGYSKILIQTFVLPNYGGAMRDASLDLTMWMHCGMERTESQWHKLVAKAELKITRIVKAMVGPYAVIECDFA